MVQLRLILRLFMVATLRTVECSTDGLWAMSRGRKFSKASERGIYPADTVYVPYRGSVPNLLLSSESFGTRSKSLDQCKTVAPSEGANFWTYNNTCYTGKLKVPVCRVENANETGYMIMESFLTDGSPDDEPFLSPDTTYRLMLWEPNVAFRVLTPTILEFPEFTTEMVISALRPLKLEYGKSDLRGKILVFPKLGGIVATDDSILVDPSCHTNHLCGVPFLTTSVEAVKTPHFALDQYCGQTIDFKDTQFLNVFSHAGIGCKLFPDVYTTPNCELTITSNSAISANVTLVNFRKTTTCGGYELKFVTFPCEGVVKEVDACQENAPTVFHSSEGKMQVKLTGSASENWHRYGFIIRLEEVTKSDDSSQCSSVNSVQGATEDFSQVSTTAPPESPTNSPVQNPTDGSVVDLPQASPESSSGTEFISDPAESFVSKSPSVSPKSPTNPHHLHLLLALGIGL